MAHQNCVERSRIGLWLFKELFLIMDCPARVRSIFMNRTKIIIISEIGILPEIINCWFNFVNFNFARKQIYLPNVNIQQRCIRGM